jgi:hypothetical protein
MQTTFRLLLLFFMISTNLWSNSVSSPWYSQDSEKKVIINVELFLSSACAHCHKAEAFFRELETKTPWIHIQRHIINQDKTALIRFNQLLTEQKMNDFAVPSVFFCNSRWVGFASAQTTGNDLLHAMTFCKQQIEKNNRLTDATIDVVKRWANANLFDSGMIENPSHLRYLITMALMDAFNPCAWFCLAGFFALLFMPQSTKERIVAGFLYVGAIAVVHYFQQEYAGIFFEALPWFRLPALLVGCLIFYWFGQYYKKKEINCIFFILAFLLGFMLQSYQQTCVMNWSYIFSQWLNHQPFNNGEYLLFQLAYQLIYITPLILTVLLYSLLIQIRSFSAFKSFLFIMGLLFLWQLAAFLIFYPGALSNFFWSLWILFILIIGSWISNKLNWLSSNKQ